jgi:predicted HTH transcriptional regulator
MPTDLLSTIRQEIDERLEELRPLMDEYERLLDTAEALLTIDHDSSDRVRPSIDQAYGDVVQRPAAGSQRSRKRARSGSQKKSGPTAHTGAREAILAALEHGSHTGAELSVVTAMNGPSITRSLRKLVAERAVVKVEREGKGAWALPDAFASHTA